MEINQDIWEQERAKYGTYDKPIASRPSIKFITYNSETKSLKQWALEIGISYATLSSRLHQNWSVEQALFTPVRTTNKVTYKGRTQTLAAWSRETGINRMTLFNRINNTNWTLEEAFSFAPFDKGKILINYSDKKKYLIQWARELGIKRDVLYQRIFILKWSVERAFTEPVRPINNTKSKAKRLTLRHKFAPLSILSGNSAHKMLI